ncbi:hypothetical protein KXV92_007812, partial [Aspergillus fumigatus]
MDGQGRVPSFEILTRDKGMAKSDTLSQGQTRRSRTLLLDEATSRFGAHPISG